jgi:hypothetical protein
LPVSAIRWTRTDRTGQRAKKSAHPAVKNTLKRASPIPPLTTRAAAKAFKSTRMSFWDRHVAETSDEVDALREALGRQQRSAEYVDDDRPLPHPRAARVLRFRPSLMICRCEEGRLNLRLSCLPRVPNCRIGGRPDRIRTREREKTAGIALDCVRSRCSSAPATRRVKRLCRTYWDRSSRPV